MVVVISKQQALSCGPQALQGQCRVVLGSRVVLGVWSLDQQVPGVGLRLAYSMPRIYHPVLVV